MIYSDDWIEVPKLGDVKFLKSLNLAGKIWRFHDILQAAMQHVCALEMEMEELLPIRSTKKPAEAIERFCELSVGLDAIWAETHILWDFVGLPFSAAHLELCRIQRNGITKPHYGKSDGISLHNATWIENGRIHDELKQLCKGEWNEKLSYEENEKVTFDTVVAALSSRDTKKALRSLTWLPPDRIGNQKLDHETSLHWEVIQAVLLSQRHDWEALYFPPVLSPFAESECRSRRKTFNAPTGKYSRSICTMFQNGMDEDAIAAELKCHIDTVKRTRERHPERCVPTPRSKRPKT